MATAYKELYSSVYAKIKDYDFVNIPEDEVDEIMRDYLRPAIVAFEDCSQDLSDRDEELKCFNFDLSDVNFEILSNFMVIVYLDSTFIRTSLALRPHMSTADFHKYDNANVLGKVIEVRDMYKRENKQWMINYSLRGDSKFSKLYSDMGSYDPHKSRKNRHDFKQIEGNICCRCCRKPNKNSGGESS